MTSCVTSDMDETGVITMVSRDLCAVSVNINGTLQTLSFGKRILYTWGNQCEGDMTNILEEDMEVNVCYKFPESQDTPSVVAVWIGDKPDLSDSVESLVDVYSQRGYVHDILDCGSFIVRSDSTQYTVVVNKEVMYRDGCLLDVSISPIAVGECLLFDAFPLEFAHTSGAMYQATCAWIGKEPRLVDRFSLNNRNSDEQKLGALAMNRVYGTVVVVPNNVVAFAEVEDAEVKVMLFRNSFNQSCERIQHVINVGDRLCMQLCFAYTFGGCGQWLAVRAWTSGEEETEENNDVSINHPVAFSHHTNMSAHAPKSAFVGADSQQIPVLDGDKVTLDKKSKVLYSDPPLKGTFSFVSKSRGLISYKHLWILARKSDIYTNGSPYNSEELSAACDDSGQIIVYFEAVEKLRTVKKVTPEATYVVTHDATCVWIGKRPSLLTVASNLHPACSLFKRETSKYFGRVSKLYLPDVALVTTPGKNPEMVYVHLNSFINSQHSSGNKFITDFVTLKSSLSFNVTQDRVCDLIVRATNVTIVAKRKNRGPSVAVSKDDSSQENLQELSSEELDDVRVPAVSFNAKSKTLLSDPPLQGIIIFPPKSKGTIGIITYQGLKICVHLRDVYVKGQPCTKEQFCSLVESKTTVKFEAILYCERKCKTDFTHHATCVWVGEKPSLSVVTSSLAESDNSITSYEDRTLIGKVANFYLPDVAVLKVALYKFLVCLHLSEFDCESRPIAECADPGYYCICDFVEFCGYFEFKVRQNGVCSLGRCAYDVVKSDKLTFRAFDAANTKSDAQMSEIVHTDGETLVDTPAAIPLVPRIPTSRSLVLNCLGVIRVNLETMSAKMEHKFGSSILDTSTVYGLNGDVPLDNKTLRACNNGDFGFDAKFVITPEGSQLCVQKIWLANPEKIIASKLHPPKSVDFNPSTLYCGVITSTELHKFAIAVVNEVPVLVTLDSIVKKKADPSFTSVDIFLSVGDHVVLKIKDASTAVGTYFSATACYKLKGKAIVPDGKRYVTSWHELSWSATWGSGEYFRTGLVEEKDGNYFVDFVSSKLPSTKVSLDLSRALSEGNLFVDGKPLKQPCNNLNEREISFHVALGLPDQIAKGSSDMYIGSAWIGEYPELPTLLKHRAVAYTGVICTDWYYEGVVTDFPLPTHAICKVGVLSVLLLLRPINKSGKIVGVVESGLKRADKVVLKIKYNYVAKQTLLVSSLCTSVKTLFDESEVLKVVRGKIINIPCPVGRIKLDGAPIEVWFDRSCVRSINGIVTENKSVFMWSHLLDKTLSVGTEVYFSAAKDLTLKNSYRAYEVWIGRLPK